MATSLAEQLPASYIIKFNYLDDTAPSAALKVEILDEGNNVIWSDDTLEQGADHTHDVEQAGSYTVIFYLWNDLLNDWEDVQSLLAEVLEWQMQIDWYYTVGTNYEVTPDTDYYYLPDSFILNNQACVVPAAYPSQISYQLYDLVNGVWVESSLYYYTYDLSTWDDNDPDWNALQFTYRNSGWPVKIVTTVSNCNQQVTHDTYVDDGFLITSSQAVNQRYETQIPGSYTIQFSYIFQDGFYPHLIITPENNAQCNLYIYKNEEVIATYFDLQPGENFTYTFNEATKQGSAEYKVRYNSVNPDYPEETFNQEIVFIVGEYKPTFSLPEISCKQINENANIILNQLNFNCYNGDIGLHLLNPDPLFTPNIRYTVYYFNKDTYAWDQQLQVNTPGLDADAVSFYNEDNTRTDFDVSQYLQNKYYFGSDQTSPTLLWTPDKLTMVKLLVEVTNYTTTVAKETIFPICGSWKLRRMSCGNYRLYNYTADVGYYPLMDLKTNAVLKTIEVPPFSFTNFSIDNDGIYKITGNGTTRYIFNFCAIEGCVLELQKKVLLDDTLCDACKLDKVLYQKALRLIPIYETWKKLLDKDWVYEIQYQSTDIDGSLEAIYDADELYAELKLLCDQCTSEGETKGCKC